MQLPNQSILLVGSGNIGIEYAKVLKEFKKNTIVVGRGKQSAKVFEEAVGIKVFTGGIYNNESILRNDFEAAIVAVSMEELAETTIFLMRQGIKKILVEKPAGLTPNEVNMVARESIKQNAKVYVAYNRRFYSSILEAKRMIDEDGGITSFQFEFTEWSHIVEKLQKPREVLENWLFGNSTHVIDLAFFLGGQPEVMKSFSVGETNFHTKGAIFSGAGVTKSGALFSYNANWKAPGRWGLEVLTNKRRFFFRPLEELHVQRIGKNLIERVEIDDHLDKDYKPGIYRQVNAFLHGINKESLLDIVEHSSENCKIYERILQNDGG